MFTGIVEEMGTVRSMVSGGESAVIALEGSLVLSDLRVGDSVCVNGVCLTVTRISGNVFYADVMNETLSRSSLGVLVPGGKVNLERAMPVDGRFGGHIVSGHIDGTGRIVSLRRDSNAIWYEIECDDTIMRYIVEKGSVTIDGISLTVAKVTATTFSVSVIPHTAKVTTLGLKGPGDVVNLENDIIGKYVEKLLEGGAPSVYGGGERGFAERSAGGLTESFLAESGFM